MSVLRILLVYIYAPAFLIGFMGLGLTVIEAGGDPRWLVPLVGAAILISLGVEWVIPYEPRWNLSKGDTRRDLLHAAVNELLTVLSVSLIPLLAMVMPSPGLWPTSWPLWLQLGLAMVIADFGITLTHFASHRWVLLWRLHAVHHSVQRLYGFNGLMKHPAHQIIETVAGSLPLLLLGLPYPVGMLLGFAVVIQLLLQHSNADYRLGPLGYLWAAAPGHRHHHLAHPSLGDVNFGLFTLLWDHALGTFVLHRPAPRDGELGITDRPDYPVAYFPQLIEPFTAQ